MAAGGRAMLVRLVSQWYNRALDRGSPREVGLPSTRVSSTTPKTSTSRRSRPRLPCQCEPCHLRTLRTFTTPTPCHVNDSDAHHLVGPFFSYQQGMLGAR